MIPVIEAHGLQRRYGSPGVLALAGADLIVPAGQFVALVGTSGSGKSTLLQLLGCLDRPDAGSYKLNGEEVSQLDDNGLARVRNQKIGFVFQSFHLLPRLRADANVALPLRYARWSEAKRLKRARELLARVGLGIVSTTCRRSSRAASASGWPSHVRWPRMRRCCLRTSPRATWTASPATMCWGCSASSTPRGARSCS